LSIVIIIIDQQTVEKTSSRSSVACFGSEMIVCRWRWCTNSGQLCYFPLV